MIKNIEQIKEYYYPEDLSKNREEGISAFVRCKNEETIVPSLLSIKDFFTEIVVIFNNSADRSEELVRKLNLPNVKIFYYPFDVVPAGPDTKNINQYSLHHIVYYTNYCISLTSKKWVYRFDGDNIALPNFYELKNIVQSDRYNSIEDRAWDLVGSNCNMLGSQEYCSFEKRLIKINDNVRYILNGNQTAEEPYVPGLSYRVEESTFLHLRWCLSKPQKYWKQDWESDPHFKAIKERHLPIKKYEGKIPFVLQKYLELNRNSDKLIELYHNGELNG